MVVDLANFRRTKSVKQSIPFGERVAIARKNQGFTQGHVGEKVCCDRSVVSKWETGALRPQPEDVAALSSILHAPDLLTHYCNECPVCAAKREMTPKPAA